MYSVRVNLTLTPIWHQNGVCDMCPLPRHIRADIENELDSTQREMRFSPSTVKHLVSPKISKTTLPPKMDLGAKRLGKYMEGAGM